GAVAERRRGDHGGAGAEPGQQFLKQRRTGGNAVVDEDEHLRTRGTISLGEIAELGIGEFGRLAYQQDDTPRVAPRQRREYSHGRIPLSGNSEEDLGVARRRRDQRLDIGGEKGVNAFDRQDDRTRRRSGLGSPPFAEAHERERDAQRIDRRQ